MPQVPPVPADLLIEANKAIGKRRTTSLDVTLVATFADTHSADELIALSHRFRALHKLVVEGKGDAWVMTVKGKKYKLVNEAMFKAAARAPLKFRRNQVVGDIAFDADTFLKIALEEVETSGAA